MEYKELGLPGVWMGKSRIFQDNRGSFQEWFLREEFKSISGIDFEIAQSNTSKSLKNVMRGIHYSVASNGQAKWVTCVSGSILDVVVDFRKDSPNFGKWILTKLESENGECLYVPDGFGHGFQSLEDNALVVYNLTSKYQPQLESTINLFDPTLKIDWPICQPIISQRDLEAPNFLEVFLSASK
jgi:dTDP-4-dehydrorhamnose 3,5-epimerase